MHSPRSLGLALLFVGATLSASVATAQVPEPIVRDVNRRSGLITRYAPVARTLPPDRDRDQWYDTRWGDRPDFTHVNCYKHGGLYGLQFSSRCTASVYPFFYGAPGGSTIDCEECEPAKSNAVRLYDNFLHPWRPVGMYYSKGSYVPIYDLDPIAPGPGPFPFRHFFNAIKGG